MEPTGKIMVRAAVFDAYGTIFNLDAALHGFRDRIGPAWAEITRDWRVKQLEYAWVRSLAGAAAHRDFWRLTREALEVAAARHGLADAALLDEIMQAYRALPAYPEVAPALAALRERGIARVILTNGEPAMTKAAIAAARLAPLLDAVLSAELVGTFKPDPSLYALVKGQFGAGGGIAFLSSNPWDVFGAAQAGLRAIRVNRTGAPDEYGLRGRVPEIAGLDALPALLAREADA